MKLVRRTALVVVLVLACAVAALTAVDATTWTDHVDLRPTINALLGLQDGYLDNHANTTEQLGAAYNAINAPFGDFALKTLVASPAALESTDPLGYDRIESAIADLAVERDVLAGTIRRPLSDAAGGSGAIDEKQAKDWIASANDLLAQARQLAASS